MELLLFYFRASQSYKKGFPELLPTMRLPLQRLVKSAENRHHMEAKRLISNLPKYDPKRKDGHLVVYDPDK